MRLFGASWAPVPPAQDAARQLQVQLSAEWLQHMGNNHPQLFGGCTNSAEVLKVLVDIAVQGQFYCSSGSMETCEHVWSDVSRAEMPLGLRLGCLELDIKGRLHPLLAAAAEWPMLALLGL